CLDWTLETRAGQRGGGVGVSPPPPSSFLSPLLSIKGHRSLLPWPWWCSPQIEPVKRLWKNQIKNLNCTFSSVKVAIKTHAVDVLTDAQSAPSSATIHIGGWYWRGGCHHGSWPSWLSRYRRPIRQTFPASHSRFRRHVAVSIRCRRTRSCLRLLGGELSVMPAKTRDLTLDSSKDSTTAAVACPPALLRAHVAIDWAGEHASSSPFHLPLPRFIPSTEDSHPVSRHVMLLNGTSEAVLSPGLPFLLTEGHWRHSSLILHGIQLQQVGMSDNTRSQARLLAAYGWMMYRG
ncbi:hypothetical protein GQ607_015620, partial [Colletotrichum asianum]